MLKIIPLGGLGEIGLNMTVFEYEDSMFVVDAGLMFPEDYMFGIDIVIPDMSYLKKNKSKLLGVVLTHGHEDHIGALPYLIKDVNVPIFGTRFTLGIVKHKLEERGLLEKTSLHEISSTETLKIGVFELEFIQVNHSIVGGVGIAIKTPIGVIVHTGDFKISSSALPGQMTDINRFSQYGLQGVLALMSDSTNVEKEGHTRSSEDISKTLSEVTEGREGRIIVALFASNIGRIQLIVKIAEKRKRKIVFIGRSIEKIVCIAKDLGYLTIPDDMEIRADEIGNYPDSSMLMVMTGSQGEPMSALALMASKSHARISIKEKDTVILSSKFIPGNEKAIAKIINNLYRLGADVIYEKISAIHISGHAFQEELKMMIRMTKPKYFIPIHGEYRHLTLHGRLAEKIGILRENIIIAEDGQVIKLDKNGGRIDGSVHSGRVLVDGKGIGDVGTIVLRERRTLSEDGFVAVTIAFDEATGYIVYGPNISSRGFIFETTSGHILEDAQCVVLEVIEDIPMGDPDRKNQISLAIQKALKKYFYYTIRRRPIILPFILEV
jgi:ribonuclease J